MKLIFRRLRLGDQLALFTRKVDVKTHVRKKSKGGVSLVKQHQRKVQEPEPEREVEPQRIRFEVLGPNWGRFRYKFDALVAKAEKLGVEAPQLRVISEGTKEAGRTVFDAMAWGDDRWKTIVEDYPYTEVEVTGPTVQIGGWTARAIVSPMPKDKEGRPVSQVASLGDTEGLPASLWSTEMHCDHCNLKRARKQCWALQSGSGKWMQVGSACLADFAGRSPQQMAAAAEWLSTIFIKDLDQDVWGDELSGTGDEKGRWDIMDVLAVAAWVVEQDGGYISKARAEAERRDSTPRQVVQMLLEDRVPEALKKARNVYRARGEAVVAWMQTLDPEKVDSDYQRNLHSASRSAYLTDKQVGLVASAISGYQRWLEDADRRRLQAARAERGYGQRWLGEPGDKIGRKLSKKDREAGATAHPKKTVVVSNVISGESMYGPWSMVMAHDAEGHVYKINYSGGRTNWNLGDRIYEPFTRGETFALVGTIKKNGSWTDRDGNETKQTEISRAVMTRTLTESEQPIYDAGFNDNAAEYREWAKSKGEPSELDEWSRAEAERAGWRAVRSAHETGAVQMAKAQPMSKGMAEAPGYRMSDNGTECGRCHWDSGGSCELYMFRWAQGFTCDSWQPPGDQMADAPAPGNGFGGRAVSDKVEMSKGCGCKLRKCDSKGQCKKCKHGFVGGPAEHQKRNQAMMVVAQRARKGMHKGVMPEGALPIIAMDETVGDSPVSESWRAGAYTMSYRQGKGIGVLTATGGGLVLPFHQVCGNASAARMQARTLAQQLDSGVTPEQGVYRPMKVPRAKYRKDQGGVRL